MHITSSNCLSTYMNCSHDDEHSLGKHRVYAQHTYKHIHLLLFLVYSSYLIVAVAQNGCR